MALETAKHFDAPDPPSAVRLGLRLIGARWGAFVALACVTALLFVGVVGVFGAVAMSRAAYEAAIAATTAVVVLDPQAIPADAEATGARIRAIPGVASATFRSRDDALKDLAARGLPAPDGRNPLPDVWTLRLSAVDGGPPGERVAAVTAAARDLPHVSAVRFDPRWGARLDDAERRDRGVVRPLAGAVLVALAMAVFCVAFLGGGASAGAEEAASKSALAIAAVGIAVASAAVTAAFVAVAPAIENRMLQSGVQGDARFTTGLWTAIPPWAWAATWAAATALLIAGLLLGSRSTR